MKRFLPILLALSLLVCLFASCDTLTAAAAMTKAEKALEDIPYTVTVSMDFACEDETLNAVFDALSLELPVTVDSENLHLDMSTEVMGFKTGITMTVVDKVLYANTTVMNQSVKLKATLTEENYEEFIKDNNTELPVTAESFETLSMEVKDGKQIVTCSGISTEGLTAMNDHLADTFKALGAEAAAGDLTLVATISDGLFESLTLNATYSVTVEGETHTLSLTMNAEYSYEDVQPITAPTDADSYEDVGFDGIMGK
jgi:hypothetical protein